MLCLQVLPHGMDLRDLQLSWASPAGASRPSGSPIMFSRDLGLQPHFLPEIPPCLQVLLDGRDLRDLPLSWLRQQMGLVSQEPTLFATTIYQNILFGKPSASRAEVEAAAAAANAHKFISALPKGYETLVRNARASLHQGPLYGLHCSV